MDYNALLELAADLGYELAMSGAETFRVEESVTRMLSSYGVQAECFAIPNNLLVSIETPDGKPMTRMRRIGHHGNDIDAVERFSGLSRAFCNRQPAPEEGRKWLAHVRSTRLTYHPGICLLGDFLGSAGFAVLFGGNLVDALFSGICGLIIGIVNEFLDNLQANPFFRTIATSFVMSLCAYAVAAFGLTPNPDAVIIGALMILVPGLLFTNAMRDIIYGDTNSGINRVVQVFLVAVAIALGTATAWSCAARIWGTPVSAPAIDYTLLLECIACLVGCVGFTILFNIHGKGSILCAIGGVLTWAVYAIVLDMTGNDLLGYFWGAFFASAYSEIMARIRKCPAIGYLVVCIFPLIPGAGVYYTMLHAVRGEMALFASQGMHTAAIAGLMAVGILLVSTTVRLYTTWKQRRK